MGKIEFSDIHKFIVSIGIALIFLSIIIPWLFFREKFDLLTEEEELTKLTDVAQKIILFRQELLLDLVKVLPFFSGLVLLVGIAFLIFGLVRWNRKQKVFDEHQEILLSKTKKELEVMSLGERIENAVKASEEDITNDSTAQSKSALVLKNMEINSKLCERITYSYSKDYKIKPDMKIGKQYFDILMRSTIKSDIIIEIKYFRNLSSLRNIDKNTTHLKLLLSNYIEYTKKKNALIKMIVVLPAVEYEKISKIDQRMINELNYDIKLLNEDFLDNLEGDFLEIGV